MLSHVKLALPGINRVTRNLTVSILVDRWYKFFSPPLRFPIPISISLGFFDFMLHIFLFLKTV